MSTPSERWQQVKRILDAVLEAQEAAMTPAADDPGVLVALLDEHCGDDHQLRAEVLELLEVEPEVETFLEGSPAEALKLAEIEAGDAIGPYRILRRIGEGGMGTVYEAQQQRPVERRVAIKVVKLGMDTKRVVARFESERQALAVMSHPSIARVFDAGTTERGRPYFVMEFVEGVPLSEYCDRAALGVRQRLEIFLEICEGVQHAHQKGIIHRDLKPSNVLVQQLEERAAPKIIDFGIAKATSQRAGAGTIVTELGQLIGTPEYMSPEQAEMAAVDVDTRSDVYSLGVMLYELLCGFQPFTGLRDAPLDEIRRQVREVDPPSPSHRLAAADDELAKAAAGKRSEHVDGLRRQLKGDLDWIVAKAMAKEPERRYSSVSELAADVTRHLHDEPVLAGPAGTGYRIRKFVRRHRGVVVAAGLLFATLAVGVAGTSLGLIRATRAELLARQEAERANQESETASQALEFLIDLFQVSDPSEARGNTVTAREILDRGAVQITKELEDRPIIQARLMATIGRVYYRLGLYPAAEQLLKAALTARTRLLGEDHLDVATNLMHLGRLYRDEGRYNEAEDMHRRALAVCRAVLEPDDPAIAEAMNGLGMILTSQGNYGEAEDLFRQALVLNEQRLGEDHEATAVSLSNLGNLYARQGAYKEAEPFFTRSLEIREHVFGGDHPQVAIEIHNLATLHKVLGHYEQAETLFQRALAVQERVLGEKHWIVASSLNGLAETYAYEQRYDEAERLFRRARKILLATVGEEHPMVAENLRGLANLCRDQGRYAEAEAYYEPALALQRRLLGPQHREFQETQREYAELLRLRERRSHGSQVDSAALASSSS